MKHFRAEVWDRRQPYDRRYKECRNGMAGDATIGVNWGAYGPVPVGEEGEWEVKSVHIVVDH